MKKLLSVMALVLLVGFTSAQAATIVLTFEGLQDFEPVGPARLVVARRATKKACKYARAVKRRRLGPP